MILPCSLLCRANTIKKKEDRKRKRAEEEEKEKAKAETTQQEERVKPEPVDTAAAVQDNAEGAQAADTKSGDTPDTKKAKINDPEADKVESASETDAAAATNPQAAEVCCLSCNFMISRFGVSNAPQASMHAQSLCNIGFCKP